MTIAPDTKDWTWVLDRPCPECGFAAGAVAVEQFGEVIRDNALTWRQVLTLSDVAVRPEPEVWSPLEYAAHVRDVNRIFDLRLGLMLDEDEPTFPNWDQDDTAVAEQYAEQDPTAVSEELMAAAASVAQRYDTVPAGAWGRRGLRSNGSDFTVESIGRYHLHDLVHHAWDVRAASSRVTVGSYDASAAAYRDGTLAMPDSVAEELKHFVAALGEGARVLEIGSGPGRDARALEAAGVDVRRTDISPGFVDLLRAGGHTADVLDPLHDDLDDPARPGTPYDGVWASACLLHVDRGDLPAVLTRLAEVTRVDGRLHLSLKEGDGQGWSVHGNVTGARHFTYWHEEPLCEVLVASGWQVDGVGRSSGRDGERWLEVRARRA